MQAVCWRSQKEKTIILRAYDEEMSGEGNRFANFIWTTS